ncbi:MAG: tetratricopeptide repeat protein, partial [Ignavibacteria bacterium]|nr:tetratricopeptide repeat protein [Ignavibacteria bacterium]
AAINLNQEDEIAYQNRAGDYIKLGKFSEAIADLTKAIKLDPMKIDFYYSRAEAKVGLNNFLGAAVDYTQIINLDPGDALSYYNRGICYANIELKENACTDFIKAGDLGLFEAYEVIKEYCKKDEK